MVDQIRVGLDQEGGTLKVERGREGGFTYLARVLEASAESGDEVIMIDTTQLFVTYQYQEGHSTFREGIKVHRGDIHKDLEGWNDGSKTGGMDLNHTINGFNLVTAFYELYRNAKESLNEVSDQARTSVIDALSDIKSS